MFRGYECSFNIKKNFLLCILKTTIFDKNYYKPLITIYKTEKTKKKWKIKH
jgi:hypothetical protein